LAVAVITDGVDHVKRVNVGLEMGGDSPEATALRVGSMGAYPNHDFETVRVYLRFDLGDSIALPLPDPHPFSVPGIRRRN